MPPNGLVTQQAHSTVHGEFLAGISDRSMQRRRRGSHCPERARERASKRDRDRYRCVVGVGLVESRAKGRENQGTPVFKGVSEPGIAIIGVFRRASDFSAATSAVFVLLPLRPAAAVAARELSVAVRQNHHHQTQCRYALGEVAEGRTWGRTWWWWWVDREKGRRGGASAQQAYSSSRRGLLWIAGATKDPP